MRGESLLRNGAEALLEATAHDDVGVSFVAFVLDGTVLATDGEPPFEFSWNTELVDVGGHLLVARAEDLAGNLAESGPVEIRVVRTPGEDPYEPIVEPDAPLPEISGRLGCASTAAGPLLLPLCSLLAVRRGRRKNRLT